MARILLAGLSEAEPSAGRHHAIKTDDLHPHRHGPRHHRRLSLQHYLARSADREGDCRLYRPHHRSLPAPDQDDHRAARLLDPGRRHRAYGRHSVRGAHRRQGAHLVRRRFFHLAAHRPDHGQPAAAGDSLNLPLPDAGASTNLKAASLSLKEFVTHLVPKSAIEAMANNEILQIVVFSIFFGVALASLGAKGKLLAEGFEQVADVMLRVTGYIMNFAPIAVFAAMAAIITTQGLGVLITYGKFMLEFYLSLAILWCVLALAGYALMGRAMTRMLSLIKEPFLLAFSTASSEAAYPKTLRQLEVFGVPNRITSFVLPMGYSFNLDGSMMYCTFAAIFIAQAYNIPLTLGQEFTMLLLLMVTSKGMAGVPRASLVVISATLSTFNIPEAGLLLIIGIDQFLDMGRSATNVLGNSIATAAVAKWEGQLTLTDQSLDKDIGVTPVPAE